MMNIFAKKHFSQAVTLQKIEKIKYLAYLLTVGVFLSFVTWHLVGYDT